MLFLLVTHQSRLSPRAFDFPKENGAVLLSFPPHSAPRLNPYTSPFTELARSFCTGCLTYG
jgi:hypothetical protein